jgi:OPA family glycerol-3-phosphate transporter-like MFS transporter
VLLVGGCIMAMVCLAPTLWHKNVASQSREALA